MPDSNVTRRGLLLGLGAGGLAAAAAGCAPDDAANAGVYVASTHELRVGSPIQFTYPENDVALLVDLGEPVAGGVGPGASIVAFSGLCQHMGCPIEYSRPKGQFVCPCHASAFDALRDGHTVAGPSPSKLPRILLRVSQKRIFAVGVQGGVVYGRATNQA